MDKIPGGPYEVSNTNLLVEEYPPPPPKSPLEDDDGGSLRIYYATKVKEAEELFTEKSQNVRRLQAQRDEINNKVRALKEELMHLHEQGSNVGEVVKVMDKKKVLVKVC